MSISIQKDVFGTLDDGTVVNIFTLRNDKGMEARITNYGGILTNLIVPDRNGKSEDVVLGFDTLKDYVTRNVCYFGALVGRYGNRIANGKFVLNGQTYTLAQNNGTNSLHGGIKGFNSVVWKARAFVDDAGPGVELTYVSKDGEEGYPGNLTVKATYTLTPDNAIKLEYLASSDKDTVINLTHHSYFNLSGKEDILDDELQLNAKTMTPVNNIQIPTGEIRPVKGTPFDFTKPVAIGARIEQDDEQLKFGAGYDHNFVITKRKGALAQAATVYDPSTGRVLEALTTEPAVQFYCGNFIDNVSGKGGRVYKKRSGFCLEPQHYPDSPNQPAFPSTVLKAGRKYKNTIMYRFSTR